MMSVGIPPPASTPAAAAALMHRVYSGTDTILLEAANLANNSGPVNCFGGGKSVEGASPVSSNTPGMMGPGSSSGGPSPVSDDANAMHKDSGMMDNEAEGVWSPDIEQSFHEALAIYPPCGRRKIILSDEGKMYGRNELIARYIKLRTGKTRTRKQVSSHIQVLARRKSREMQSQFKDQATKEKVLQSMASMSSAQIVSAGAIQNMQQQQQQQTSRTVELNQQINRGYPKTQSIWSGIVGQSETDIKPFSPAAAHNYAAQLSTLHQQQQQPPPNHVNASPPNVPVSTRGVPPAPDAPSPRDMWVSATAATTTTTTIKPWENRQIASHKLRLIDFSAFREQPAPEMENYAKHLFVHIDQSNPSYADPLLESVDIRQIYDKFPEHKGGLRDLYDKGPRDAFFLVKFWADLNVNIQDDSSTVYAVTSEYESSESMTIECSTKVCSFGKQVVEKVETEYGRYENGRFTFHIHRSLMCEYMINFILKLKHLPEKYMMNSVLENFTILQVITNRETQETLLCLAFVFEVSTSEHGAQHHMYHLVKD